jgi:ABC-type multidrug transport system fused ATPase/permease subunit
LENKAEEPFVPAAVGKHPARARLNDQLRWYADKSSFNQNRYNQIKVVQLILAGSIPVFALAAASWGRWITAILGTSVAILEGLQQLGQYNNLWASYRATAEQLKHEKHLFLAKSGPYRGLGDEEALRVLAERVEERVSTEHAKWVSDRSQQAGQQGQPGGN